MIPTPLITADRLLRELAIGQPVALFDCSFELQAPEAGAAQHAQAHIPGAVHMDLDRDLSDKSGAADTASGGRHPLPSREKFAALLRARGLRRDMPVVVYDRQGSAFAGRLWWMLLWCGHAPVAVLDGGFQAWLAAGGASSADLPAPAPGDFELRPPQARLATLDEVAQRLEQPQQTLVDARAAARFRGEVEPLDPVAGHIPGALNRPYVENLLPDGRFKPAPQLRAEFDALLAGRDPATVVHQCGSGVTAIPNLLAMELAGLGRATLFAGSWSEWCTRPGLPCARG